MRLENPHPIPSDQPDHVQVHIKLGDETGLLGSIIDQYQSLIRQVVHVSIETVRVVKASTNFPVSAKRLPSRLLYSTPSSFPGRLTAICDGPDSGQSGVDGIGKRK